MTQPTATSQRVPAQKINVCLVSHQYSSVLQRQTPKNDFIWNDIRVSFNDEKACSWLCVYDDHQPKQWQTIIPRHRRILVVIEPKAVVQYSSTCLKQYGTVLSPYPRPDSYRGRWINAPILFPWIYGYKEWHSPASYLSWDALRRAKINKTKTLSVIYASKWYNRNQIQRTKFVTALKM